MAKRVGQSKHLAGRRPKYPWERWFRGKRFRLAKGVTYDCQTHSMAQQIRNAAGHRGIQVSLRIVADTITVTRRGAA